MHEFSIASQIWSSVITAAHQHGDARVLTVRLEIGTLNLLSEEQLRFWIEVLAERSGSEGVTIEITYLPGCLHCRACQADSELTPPPESREHLLPVMLRCPVCRSRDVAITGGHEIRVVSAEIEPKETE